MTTRREMLSQTLVGAGCLCGLPPVPNWRPLPIDLPFRQLLASCMYGYLPLGDILKQVKVVDAAAIDIWPKVHGNQREQIDEMGLETFLELLEEFDVEVGCLTQYALGPFGLQDEFKVAQKLNCGTIVTGAKGPKGMRGAELKSAVGQFYETMKPHLATAAEHEVVVAVENHSNSLIESPDSMKWLMELSQGEHLRIALAPYHLPQDERQLAQLIRDLGQSIEVFYAWQHGKGCMEKLPKSEELLQLPGRGELDFLPLMEALVEVEFKGWFEIFMHPYPRGIPILETLDQVSEEIIRSRDYLSGLVKR